MPITPPYLWGRFEKRNDRMANDTSINRTSQSNSIVPTTRKKQNAQGIDLSQQSFFEELLTIGRFKATIPEATTLPAPLPFGSDSKTERESDTKAGSEPNEESTPTDDTSNSAAIQAAAAAQAATSQIQQSKPPEIKESSIEDKGETHLVKASNKKSGDGQADAKKSVAAPSAVDAGSEVADPSTNDSAASVILDESTTITVDSSTAAESTSQLADVETKVLTGDKLFNQAVEKSRGAASADEKGDQAKSESDNPQLASNQTESKPRPGIALKELESENQSVQEQSKSDAPAVLADHPRNKRAERLAQRASDGGSSTEDHETNVDPTLDVQPTKEQAPIETEFTASTSTQSSLPTSAGASTTTPPAIVQPIAVGNIGATTISSSRSNAESIVGVNSSQANNGTQTGVSNTTLFGNVASPGRSDQGRSEVARSNSGTQITAYQEGKLVQRVLRGIEQLANGGGQVRLRLHPPELGALQMSLRMEGGQVFAKLEVENTTARDALMNNVQTLKDRMADQGMKVASFEVSVSTDSAGSGLGSSGSQSDGGTGNQSRWENSSSRFAQQNSNRLPTEPTQTERKPNAVWTRTNGSLDLTV